MAYDWNQHEIARPPWRSTIVPYLPAILIQRAKEGRTITYAELADALHDHYGLEPKARKTLYGPPVGAVGFALSGLGINAYWPPLRTKRAPTETSGHRDPLGTYTFDPKPRLCADQKVWTWKADRPPQNDV